jgi:NAD-dependent deacetylase sirtuin 4
MNPSTLSSIILKKSNNNNFRSIAILTGAGISTDSNLPDYRGKNGLYKDNEAIKHVIHHNDFMTSEILRKRYWLRSVAGFERFASAKPNRGHEILAQLEHRGIVSGIITQNVDRLHHAAGSRNVIELHGRGDLVQCMNPSCGHEISRREYQVEVIKLNQELINEIKLRPDLKARPDFDSEIPAEFLSSSKLNEMKLPVCSKCGFPVIKPSFVFFGGSVPHTVTESSIQLILANPILLVLGTTTQTLSSFRLVETAFKHNLQIGIVNIGSTRSDHLASSSLGIYNGSISVFLQELYDTLNQA